MLSREDLSWNYGVFKASSALNIFPVRFNQLTGEMELDGERSTLREFLFKVLYLIEFGYLINLTWKSVRSKFFSDNSYADFTPFMFMIAVTYFAVWVIVYLAFMKGLSKNIRVYNEILKIRGNIHSPSSPNYFFLFFKFL